MPHTLDAAAVRNWCAKALDALGRDREEIDAINVYPVADGDTGTNLYLTAESAARAVEAVFAAHGVGDGEPAPAEAVRAMAHGALIGARGNSGTILAQLLRGMATVLAERHPDPAGTTGSARASAEHLARALARAASSAREAVVHPVEGTILTVADAAALAAGAPAPDPGAVVRAAYEGARAALDATPGQLAALGSAGVVDAGGLGFLAVLGALMETVTGHAPTPVSARARAVGEPGSQTRAETVACPVAPAGPAAGEGPSFEVTYLLEADGGAMKCLKGRLDALGDCLVVGGGEGLWNIHVHTDDAGAAVEAGIEAGRPYRIRVSHLTPRAAAGAGEAVPAPGAGGARERAQRAVVAVVHGEGLAGLCGQAGATTLLVRPGEPPAGGELVEAIRRAHAREVVLLPNDPGLRHTAAAAAAQARAEGIRVALIPTRAAVQGIAALAVHQPDRRFDEDVVAMTSAAGATRYGELAVAERMAWTTAGICQAGDVLGLIEGDIAVIGADLAATAKAVLDRMLAAGGELVTLVLGDDVPDALADRLEEHVRVGHLAVDTVVHRGGGRTAPLLIGVE